MRSLVGVVVCGAVLVAGCGTKQEVTVFAPAEPSASASSARDPRVAVDGSRVTAAGRIQQVDGRVRLCSPEMVAPAIGRPPGYVAPPCWAGVWLEGIGAATAPAAVEVTGTLRGDVVVVQSQTAVEGGSELGAGLPEVPCEPPAGGWPDGGAPYDDRSPDDAALNRFHEAHPDLAASGRVLLLRPARDRQVVTVVARDQAEKAAIEAELEPAFGVRMCVVVQDGDPDVATRAQQDPRLMQERLMMSAGTQWKPGLRTRSAYVNVVRITELMVKAEAEYPIGTLVLRPFLRVLDA